MPLPAEPAEILATTALLFGEAPSRIVVSLAPDQWEPLATLAASAGVPLTRLGVVAGNRLTFGPSLDLPVADLRTVWRNGLARALGSGPATAE